MCVFLPMPSRCCEHGCSAAQVSRGESRICSGKGVEARAKTQSNTGIAAALNTGTFDAGKLSGFFLHLNRLLTAQGCWGHPVWWVPLCSTQLGLGESTQGASLGLQRVLGQRRCAWCFPTETFRYGNIKVVSEALVSEPGRREKTFQHHFNLAHSAGDFELYALLRGCVVRRSILGSSQEFPYTERCELLTHTHAEKHSSKSDAAK